MAMPGTPRPGARGGWTVPVVEQRGEQRHLRRHAAGLLGQRQRRVLMGQQPGQLGPHRGHRLGHAAAADPDPHRQRVHERPRHPVRARPGIHPAEQHRAEHHVITAGQHRASTRAHARWNTVAGDTPSARARSRTRPARLRVHRQPGPLRRGPVRRGHPAARTARSARSRPPAGRRSTARCSSRGTPSRACATKSRNGSGSGSRSPCPASSAAISPSTTSIPVWSVHQVMQLQQRQPPPGPPARRPCTAAAAAPGPGPSAARPRPASPATGSAVAVGGQASPRSPAAAPAATPPAPARAAPPRPPRSGRCHAGRSPAAARRRTPPAGPGTQTAAPTCPGTRPRRRRRPAGDGRTCPPAAAPAGRCRPRSPPRRPPRATIRPICSAVSSTSGSMSGVICARPGRDQVRRHRHAARPGHRGQPGRGRRLEQRPHRHLHPALRSRSTSRTASSECPPRAKKSSSGPTRVQAEHLGEHGAQDLLATVAGPRPPAAAAA